MRWSPRHRTGKREEVAKVSSRAVESLTTHTSLVRSGEAILPEENVEGQVRGRD